MQQARVDNSKWWSIAIAVATIVLSMFGSVVAASVRLSLVEERLRVAAEEQAGRTKFQAEMSDRLARIEESMKWLTQQRGGRP